MEQGQACIIDQSTEFLCPTCGTSAFEVLGTKWGRDENDQPAEFIVMRCLDCLELFHHHLSNPLSSPQSAGAVDGTNLMTDILGPIPGQP